MATGPSRDTYRYHPLLAEMLRAELQRRPQDEVKALQEKRNELDERRELGEIEVG